jgi:hypothetical protein
LKVLNDFFDKLRHYNRNIGFGWGSGRTSISPAKATIYA